MGSRAHFFTSHHIAAVVTTTATAVFILMFVTGCGDTFRPVANPITQPGGDPAGVGDAIFLSANPGTTPGTTTHVNVSGDTVTAVLNVGSNPVHAILAGAVVIVANRNDGTVSLYPISAGPGGSVQTITLPSTVPNVPDAVPLFLATDNSNVYVAQNGRNSVEVISLASLIAVQEIKGPISAPITAPTAIAFVSKVSKVYVANNGAGGQVSIIDPALAATDPVGAVKGQIAVGGSPSAVVASADGNCVYVANAGSATVSVINTSNDTAAVGTIPVGSTPSFLVFDKKLQRVYVANSGTNTISIINHAADCSATTATSVNVGGTPTSITALSDGSRVYVSNIESAPAPQDPKGRVSVILTSSNTIKTFPGQHPPDAIGAGTSPVSIGSSTDGAKVFVADSSGAVFVIRTANDGVVPNVNLKPSSAGASPQFVLMF